MATLKVTEEQLDVILSELTFDELYEVLLFYKKKEDIDPLMIFPELKMAIKKEFYAHTDIPETHEHISRFLTLAADRILAKSLSQSEQLHNLGFTEHEIKLIAEEMELNNMQPDDTDQTAILKMMGFSDEDIEELLRY